MTPLRDAKNNQISFFVGIQYEVSGPGTASSTSLLSLTALSADRLGVVMGRGSSVGNGVTAQNNNNNNNNNNLQYHHLPPQLRVGASGHLGLVSSDNGSGLEGSSMGHDYGGMMGFGDQFFANDRSNSSGGTSPSLPSCHCHCHCHIAVPVQFLFTIT